MTTKITRILEKLNKAKGWVYLDSKVIRDTITFNEFDKIMRFDCELWETRKYSQEKFKDLCDFGVFIKVNQSDKFFVQLDIVRSKLCSKSDSDSDPNSDHDSVAIRLPKSIEEEAL